MKHTRLDSQDGRAIASFIGRGLLIAVFGGLCFAAKGEEAPHAFVSNAVPVSQPLFTRGELWDGAELLAYGLHPVADTSSTQPTRPILHVSFGGAK